ncbi:hypothetical protein [Pseudomonas cichorii]|uniref:hypothetical protein n=1 Tax=Pseudomonas cichorii TaxID=36746 RepID=UPI001C8A2805|nr:hypothetical protein [Pseudomonas cichorii]MBX8517961.1 hypothetical protein [Pseudomonas cichorii]MBX8531866.1 hypothetical protein [Pseudomonas cichorii]MBX8577878.1 hypothetical protein [Pseudomonas cichorii]
MFFGKNRKALLEFLRNLTPQVLFLTLAFIFSSKLDLSKFDLSFEGFKRTMPFLSCALVFAGAFLANMTQFIEAALTTPDELKPITDEITLQEIKFWPRIWKLTAAAWKHNKLGFLEVVLVLIITYIAFFAVTFVAIQGAVNSSFL